MRSFIVLPFIFDKDPHELKNLYGQPGQEKRTAELRAQLKALIRKYDDKEAEKILQKG